MVTCFRALLTCLFEHPVHRLMCCLSESEFYCGLVYKFKQIMGRNDLSDQFRKVKIRHKHIGYNSNVMRQSVCLLINSITVDNFAALFFNSGVRLYEGPDLKLFSLVGWAPKLFVCCLVHRGSNDDILLQISSVVVWQSRNLQLSHNTSYLLSPRYCFFIVLYRDLFVYRDDPLAI